MLGPLDAALGLCEHIVALKDRSCISAQRKCLQLQAGLVPIGEGA